MTSSDAETDFKPIIIIFYYNEDEYRRWYILGITPPAHTGPARRGEGVGVLEGDVHQQLLQGLLHLLHTQW